MKKIRGVTNSLIGVGKYSNIRNNVDFKKLYSGRKQTYKYSSPGEFGIPCDLLYFSNCIC